ncbi:MAG: helix-turn-helix transcriptional regulator [Bacilli bacterium]|jgi:transcriptional regulator with XRE-family HTH domain|nr:helix-turn-helix transcriptional regulator [Bacilli bacterium]
MRLVELRKEIDIPVRKLEEYTGIARSTISSIENGTREPTPEQAMQLASFFDVSEKYLLGESDEWINVYSEFDGIFYRLNEKEYESLKKQGAIDLVIIKSLFTLKFGDYSSPNHSVSRNAAEECGRDLSIQRQVNFSKTMEALSPEQKEEVMQYVMENIHVKK